MKRLTCLDRNTLKMIAALSMLIDHAGLLLFAGSPLYLPMRAVGRIAFPLFTYLFAEGCLFTKNRMRHFFTVFFLGAVCQAVFYIAMGTVYPLNILLTLSLSMLLVFAVENLKRAVFSPGKADLPGAVAVLLLLLGGTLLLTHLFVFDYGFLGCILPPLAALFDGRSRCLPERIQSRDTPLLRIAVTAAISALLTFSAPFGAVQLWSLLAVPLLLLYNGKPGRHRMKWFFYLFYPLHLAALAGLRMLWLLLA